MGIYSLAKINKAIQETTFVSDGEKYIFGKLEKSEYKKIHIELAECPNDYTQVINDKDELTVITPKSLWNSRFTNSFDLLKSDEVALITCEIENETVTGYMQAIVNILSPHNVTVFVQGAYTTDHIFVLYQDLDKALKLLDQLKTL